MQNTVKYCAMSITRPHYDLLTRVDDRYMRSVRSPYYCRRARLRITPVKPNGRAQCDLCRDRPRKYVCEFKRFTLSLCNHCLEGTMKKCEQKDCNSKAEQVCELCGALICDEHSYWNELFEHVFCWPCE